MESAVSNHRELGDSRTSCLDRQNTAESDETQATMVGARKKWGAIAPALTQQQTLSSRRYTHRRRVDGSGQRDGFLQCGADCSTASPAAMLSQACSRQRTEKGAEGASQSGKIVKVFLQERQTPRRTQVRSCRSSWVWRSRRPCPMIVWHWQIGHRRGRRQSGITPARSCLWSQAVR